MAVTRWGVFDTGQGNLTAKQTAMHASLLALTETQGKFSQDSGPDGCAYLDVNDNVWQGDGLTCQACVFSLGDACQIVTGSIDARGMCRYGVFGEPDDSYLDTPQRAVYDFDDD